MSWTAFLSETTKRLGTLQAETPETFAGFNTMGAAAKKTGALDEKTKESYFAGIPMKRFGKGSEVADACVFLGSDLSSYVSGQTLSVCGALNC